jgi:hypothetical protein
MRWGVTLIIVLAPRVWVRGIDILAAVGFCGSSWVTGDGCLAWKES